MNIARIADNFYFVIAIISRRMRKALKKVLFFDGINFYDKSYNKTTSSGGRVLQTLSFFECISYAVSDPTKQTDEILADCFKQGILDPAKQYSFCLAPLFEKSYLLIAIEQKSLKYFSLPNILLPFGCKSDVLEKIIFCIDDCLVAFSEAKILYFQKYEGLSDILESVEKIKQLYDIEIQKIYCKDQYESLGDLLESLECFGNQPITTLAIQCFEQHPDFFLAPKIAFFKQSLNIFLLSLLAFSVALLICLFFVSHYVDDLEKNMPIKKISKKLEDRGYFSRYLLFAEASNLAYQHHLRFESVEFSSLNSYFAIVFRVCFKQSSDLIDWSNDLQKSIKANLIFDAFKINKNDAYHCTWVSWVKSE